MGLGVQSIREIFNQLYHINPQKQSNYQFLVSYLTLENSPSRSLQDVIGHSHPESIDEADLFQVKSLNEAIDLYN